MDEKAELLFNTCKNNLTNEVGYDAYYELFKYTEDITGSLEPLFELWNMFPDDQFENLHKYFEKRARAENRLDLL